MFGAEAAAKKLLRQPPYVFFQAYLFSLFLFNHTFMYLAKSFSICYNADRQMNDSTHEVRKTPGVPIPSPGVFIPFWQGGLIP